jgi:beta-mannosidase
MIFSNVRFFRIVLGDVHYYGYSDDSWNWSTYPIARFLSETGIQALPSLDTWLQTTQNTTDLEYHSAFVDHREHSGGQINRLEYVIRSFSSFY